MYLEQRPPALSKSPSSPKPARVLTGYQRNIASIAAAVALIIFWSIPVAVVGSISQITYLIQVLPWLKWILDIPSVLLGVVTNLLPSVMLAILVSLVPPFFRLMGRIAGKPTLSSVELHCHESFFWFQVIQVFLVTTMTSAASSAVPTILEDPGSIPNLLATSLPKASNFYVSYIILQGPKLRCINAGSDHRPHSVQASGQVPGCDAPQDVQ